MIAKPMKENLWCPDRCPITLEPFFMWIEHPNYGYLPTYGGPFDSYTIPEPDGEIVSKLRKDIEYSSLHFDHDTGCWEEGFEVPSLRVVPEELVIELDAWGDNAKVCGSSLRDSQECLVEDENQFHALILKKCIKHDCLPSYLAFPFKDHLQVSLYLYYRNDPFPAFSPKHAPGKWIPVIFGGSNIVMGFDDELEVINATRSDEAIKPNSEAGFVDGGAS